MHKWNSLLGILFKNANVNLLVSTLQWVFRKFSFASFRSPASLLLSLPSGCLFMKKSFFENFKTLLLRRSKDSPAEKFPMMSVMNDEYNERSLIFGCTFFSSACEHWVIEEEPHCTRQQWSAAAAAGLGSSHKEIIRVSNDFLLVQHFPGNRNRQLWGAAKAAVACFLRLAQKGICTTSI